MKFCQRGSNSATLTTFFVLFTGREDPNITKSGPSSASQRNTIYMAFRWCANDDTTLNAGLVALRISGDPVQFAKKFHIFVIFQGGPDIGFCRTLRTFYRIIDKNISS